AILALVSLQWGLVGYSLAFGPTVNGLVGNLDFAFLRGVSADAPNPTYSATVPHQAFMVFQMMFAIITPALILGAVAERIRFSALAVFTVLWATLVYDPLAHWVWADGGWLRSLGALDFAGGLVVHFSSGVAALACALFIGRRLGWGERPMAPNNITLTLLGAGLLWFGWFGFNAGSALAANGLAVKAFVNTQLGAGAAALGWAAMELWRRGKPTGLGTASGLVAGLVAITPACGFVGPMASILIGLGAGVVCYLGCALKELLRFDDALDAWGIHGVGGAFGAVATGLFAAGVGFFATADGSLGWNPAGGRAFGVQLVGIAVTAAFSFLVTWGLLWGIDRTIGLRVPREDEERGLDAAVHGEEGYATCDCPAHTPDKHPLPAATVSVGLMEVGGFVRHR
ncbi:MAG TPA: ammonium transporter, partial [Candidatus Thermoplasmatota archaeon]|nr:ammonium transporter [Candidatus Thermoplasmatota archaeon]